MAFSNMAQLAMLASHDAAAIEWSERAIELAQRSGNNEILTHSINNLGAARLRETGDAGWLDLERSLELALRWQLQEHVARAYSNLASFAIGSRDYRSAGSHLEAGIAFCDEYELYMAQGYLQAFRARMHFEQGAWARALQEAEQLLRQPRLSTAARIPALTVVGTVHSRRGSDGADAPLEEAWVLARSTGEPQRIVAVAAARAEHAWLRGELTGVDDELRSAREYALRDRNPWRVGELVFWAQRAATPLEGALAVARPFELQLRGEFLDAALEWERIGCPYEQALALADSPDAELRKRALVIFDSLGARPMVQRLRRQLKAEGVRGVKRGANRTTRANAAGLTARELEVLALVAQDLSNAAIARRLYLSAKTVDHHASAILSKLGIASRREAAAAARRLGIALH
jgi:ATP/maltotriose-dependent transcriptional regulator MalT